MVGLTKKAVDNLTFYTYTVNGTFTDGASIIGGSVTINGIVLLVLAYDLQGDDENGSIGVDINGKDVTTGYPYDDYQSTGLFGSWTGGSGFLVKMETQSVGLPHTSFDVKNRQGSSKLFHRTVKVVVLND